MKRYVTAISLGAAAILAIGAGLASCGGDTGGGGTTTCTGTGRASGCACAADIDCARGLSCTGSPSKTCQAVFTCTADSQCVASTSQPSIPSLCTAAGVCVCVEGACQQRGCSSDAVCEAGKICVGGKCDTRPSSSGLACSIVSAPSVVRQGQTIAFVANATNSNGAIVPGQSFTWATSNSAAASIDANGVVTGGTASGTSNITCKVTGGSDTASSPVVVTNYATVAAGSVRAVVVDEKSGLPVAGATVLFRQGGNTVGGNQTTSADGSASVTATGAVDVHVFKDGYTYTSVVGTTTADILVPLTPTPDLTKAGGFKGTFDLSRVTNQSDTVEFGLAGASLSGPFIDLDFNKLIGESISKRVKIGNLYDDFLGLPSGLYLKLGDQNIKGDYAALAEGGKRHAWALGGKVPFDKLIQVLTPVLGGGSTSNIPFGQIIAQVLPFFDKFRHFIKADVTVTETPRIRDTMDINGNGDMTDLVADFNNATAFPTVNAVVSQALSLSTAVAVPNLPRYANKFLEGAIVLAGANVAGRGLVPLGISAAVDAPKTGETADGQVDTDANTAGNQSTINFKMAPLHSGIEGSKYFVVTLALSLNLGGSGAGGLGLPSSISGIVTQPERIEATTNLNGATFLGFPEGANFNLASRAFTIGAPVSGASFYRADFKGADGDWVVYFKGTAAADGFTLPTPPSGVDRAVKTSGCTTGSSCTSLRVFSLQTRAAGAGSAPTLDNMVEFGTVNLRRLNDFIGAFSNASCQASGSCAPPAQ